VVCSNSGVATLSSHGERGKQRAVLNSTPKRRRKPFICSGVLSHTDCPNSSMRPACGFSRPMISFSSTDLPVPLPPISAITSPRATVRLRAR